MDPILIDSTFKTLTLQKKYIRFQYIQIDFLTGCYYSLTALHYIVHFGLDLDN